MDALAFGNAAEDRFVKDGSLADLARPDEQHGPALARCEQSLQFGGLGIAKHRSVEFVGVEPIETAAHPAAVRWRHRPVHPRRS